MTKESRDKLIVLASKVAEETYPIFQREGWEYFSGPPSQEEIQETVIYLILSVYEYFQKGKPVEGPIEEYHRGTGRFEVYANNRIYLEKDHPLEKCWVLEDSKPTQNYMVWKSGWLL